MNNLLQTNSAHILLNCISPEEYIQKSLEIQLTRGEKGIITKLWLTKTGYVIDDIMYARNRNTYWKSIKMGTPEERRARNQKRWKKHNYLNSITSKRWSKDKIQLFLKKNKKVKNGEYQYTDAQLAKQFSTTIPGIQYWRRKQILCHKIVEAMWPPPKHKEKVFLNFMTKGEKQLKKLLINSHTL